MSFVARNHPQQIAIRGALDDIDDRATTPEIFGPLNQRYRFTLDVAASATNAKCPRYFDIEKDGLAQPWAGERVWCNPPYSNVRPWIEKAWAEQGGGVRVIVMLLPANRTEQSWWQDLVEPRRDTDRRFTVEFLPGRIRFLRPGQLAIGPNERPPFGCCLLVWRAR